MIFQGEAHCGYAEEQTTDAEKHREDVGYCPKRDALSVRCTLHDCWRLARCA
jgi:hypothetical protein